MPLGVLQYIIKNYEMEDTRPTRWPADLIATVSQPRQQCFKRCWGSLAESLEVM